MRTEVVEPEWSSVGTDWVSRGAATAPSAEHLSARAAEWPRTGAAEDWHLSARAVEWPRTEAAEDWSDRGLGRPRTGAAEDWISWDWSAGHAKRRSKRMVGRQSIRVTERRRFQAPG